MEGCLQPVHLAKELLADRSSATHDRGHAAARTSRSTRNCPTCSKSPALPATSGKSPAELGEKEIRAYQVYLTNEKKLSPGSIHTAVAALRFLYKVTLRRDWTVEDVLPLPKKATEAARRCQPRGSAAVPRLRREHQAPGDPDHLLRRGLAHLGSGSTLSPLRSTVREWSSVWSRVRDRKIAT